MKYNIYINQTVIISWDMHEELWVVIYYRFQLTGELCHG